MLSNLPPELGKLIKKLLSKKELRTLAMTSHKFRKTVVIDLMNRYAGLVSKLKLSYRTMYLFILARVGFTDILKAFIESHPNLKINFKIYISKEHNAFYSPIHFAAWSGVLSTVKLLEDKGAIYKPEQPTECFLSPLHYAADSGNPDCVTHFLDAGVPVDQQSTVACVLGWNWTSLQIASQAGTVACMVVLLQRGANVHFKDPDEYQAIHRASDGGSVAAINLLLANKADPNARNEDGVTPLADACRGDNKANTIRALLQGNANPRETLISMQFTLPLQDCILQQDLDAAKVLLDFDPTLVNAQFFNGERLWSIGMASWTALHVAASNDYEAGIIFLLSHNADVTIKNSDGQTPIDMVENKGSKVGILLLEAQERLQTPVIQPNNTPIIEAEQENIVAASWCRLC